ncbi:FliI/YscN family ATPase [Paraburkholderia bonniea]|uniref:FliI/YscN family ATPase n=1 Tax=Paraburkholderia bonniea TaxID=2152891 RepID=UPI0012917376|nr:FliI/YscN family ATPase [Paraburkholderia bonniea]WJF89340.1 FliI/YscN family ATPase [Paraburkholderia bonniea]WJF92656.1 FliI/YscN family ATPase [Paraburkholderia bonniea]
MLPTPSLSSTPIPAPLTTWLDRLESTLAQRIAPVRHGKVVEAMGTLLKVGGLDAMLGELCELYDHNGALLQRAEVVGLTHQCVMLAPFGSVAGLSRVTRVAGLGRLVAVPVGPGLLGRVVDVFGAPLDGLGEVPHEGWRPVACVPPEPMTRRLIDTAMPTGVRAIDGLSTIGEGQRVGIFAPAGVGKSTLLGMLARGTACDVNVIVLIGERGREVREFIELTLGAAGLARSVVVCATAERSALERARAAQTGTALAEYFRDQGMRVMLMMDSLTRFARAQRELGLALGEPPARGGYPPSAFAELPRLLERAGMGSQGSITAFYTVLAEGEEADDPVSEEVRGLLDGHLVLSRTLAARNRYPALDVLRSLSRVMPQVASPLHCAGAARMRVLLAKYQEIALLLQIGEYEAGRDALADEAIARHGGIETWLNQRTDEISDIATTRASVTAFALP